MFTGKIVAYINSTLQSSLAFKQFQPQKFYGVSTILPRKKAKNKQLERLPAIVDAKGEAVIIDLDDKYHMIIYHKNLANGHQLDTQKSYGDSVDLLDATDMAMIVFAQRDKIRMDAELLEAFIRQALPLTISSHLNNELRLKKVSIRTQGTDH